MRVFPEAIDSQSPGTGTGILSLHANGFEAQTSYNSCLTADRPSNQSVSDKKWGLLEEFNFNFP